mmetsp:Transcript_41248/g.84229  ORF Transcript_41248/g.84229 Transcript_41248/m.84229 type:complete len:398 (+) Transcript_41248:71-1264(+)
MAEDHSDWLNFAASCMSDVQWEVAAIRPDAVLSHRSCPWGGHLIRLDAKNVFIQNASADPADILVRPEVREMTPGKSKAEITWRCREIYAPGDALMECTNCWSTRLFGVLFGHSLGSTRLHFFQEATTVSRHALYKDFPEPGDSTQVETETIGIVRRLPHPSGNRYRLVFVFSTPEDNFAGSSLCDQHLPAFTDMYRNMFDRVVNGPGFLDMRGVDANMYLVLSLRAFNRGPPMIPHNSPCSEESFHISVGEHLGLLSWIRFKPHEKFCLREYLRCFMERLGHQLKTYEVMDGRKLVNYQCVVVRQEWEQLRTSFYQAFKVQKAAYRHANGGTSTPSLVADAAPRFALREFSCCAQPQGIKTVVRKTFIDLDEDSDDSADCLKRSNSTGEVMTLYFV